MAAIFYTSSDNDIFRGNIPFKSPINISIMSNFLGNSENVSIITELSIQTSETLQYFLTFDDVIHYLFFGKGVGNINIAGILFSDCSGSLPGLGGFYNSIGSMRGNPTTVSIGNVVFKGIISSANVTVLSEPDTMAQFQIQLAMIDHSLPGGNNGVKTGASLGTGSFSSPTGTGLSSGFSSKYSIYS